MGSWLILFDIYYIQVVKRKKVCSYLYQCQELITNCFSKCTWYLMALSSYIKYIEHILGMIVYIHNIHKSKNKQYLALVRLIRFLHTKPIYRIYNVCLVYKYTYNKYSYYILQSCSIIKTNRNSPFNIYIYTSLHPKLIILCTNNMGKRNLYQEQ